MADRRGSLPGSLTVARPTQFQLLSLPYITANLLKHMRHLQQMQYRFAVIYGPLKKAKNSQLFFVLGVPKVLSEGVN